MISNDIGKSHKLSFGGDGIILISCGFHSQ